MDEIKIVGARIHNLKNINVNIPKKKMILIHDLGYIIMLTKYLEIPIFKYDYVL